MVSSVRPEILSNYSSSQITLGDWIGKVKGKKREMRRKNTNLRVAAMLTTALRRAEAEMRHKQQERALKWAELNIQIRETAVKESEEEEEKRKREIDELWLGELNGLDNFINNFNQIKSSVVRWKRYAWPVTRCSVTCCKFLQTKNVYYLYQTHIL